eukprot:gene7671-biopygen16574
MPARSQQQDPSKIAARFQQVTARSQQDHSKIPARALGAFTHPCNGTGGAMMWCEYFSLPEGVHLGAVISAGTFAFLRERTAKDDPRTNEPPPAGTKREHREQRLGILTILDEPWETAVAQSSEVRSGERQQTNARASDLPRWKYDGMRRGYSGIRRETRDYGYSENTRKYSGNTAGILGNTAGVPGITAGPGNTPTSNQHPTDIEPTPNQHPTNIQPTSNQRPTNIQHR